MRGTLRDIHATGTGRMQAEAGFRTWCSWMMHSRPEPMNVFSQVSVLFFVRYFFRVYARGMRPVVYCLVLPNMSASFMRRLGPVNSMRRPWWMMRSMIAAASLSSAKIVPHLLNSMLVVKMMLRRS